MVKAQVQIPDEFYHRAKETSIGVVQKQIIGFTLRFASDSFMID